MDAAPITLAALAPRPLWVAWQTQERDPGGPATKVPYAPRNGHQARADDPRTWGTRAAAEARAGRLPKPFGIGGIGIEFGELTDGISLGGVDLDSCRSADGTLEPWAVEVLNRLGTYAEVSPSGTGCKAFFTYTTSDLAALQGAMGTQHGKQFDSRWWRASTGYRTAHQQPIFCRHK
jgi:putative DNA primase/helicase